MVSKDMTPKLVAELFWPSFNVPYFKEIQDAAGYSAEDWANDPRHCLFSALQASVVNMSAMEKVGLPRRGGSKAW